MPRLVDLTLGIAVAIGAVVFALAWGHPYCVTNPALCPSPSPGQTSVCFGLHTSCSSAHVVLRVGVAVVGVGLALALSILAMKSPPRTARI